MNDEEFYKWLFDKKDIHMNTSIDYSIRSTDQRILYPDELKIFFDSAPMQRLTRILQLSRNILSRPTVFHTRYEHSLGVFSRKKEVILHQLQNPVWKKYIEDNNLKVHLIAELIKSGGHDIGHLPLSHVLELSLLHKPGFHEDIGKRILLENEELQSCYKAIHPVLPSALKDVLSSDLFGFKLLDEGSFDIDRLDYLQRDSLYSFNPFVSELPDFTISEINIDSNGNPVRNDNGSINCTKYSEYGRQKVCIFEYSALPYIINFLVTRFNAYKDFYFSPEAQFFDDSIAIFLQEIQKDSIASDCELLKFTKSLSSNANCVDVNNYLKWDDITFYNSIFNFLKTTNNSELQKFGAAIMPPMFPLINMSHSLLSHSIDYSKKLKGLRPEDLEYINTLNEIISGNSTIAHTLRSEQFKEDNIFFEANPKKIAELHNQQYPGVIISSKTIKLYNPSEPIYIKDRFGNIFSLDSHPDSTLATHPNQETIYSAFTLKPLLALRNVSESEQEKIISNFSSRNPSFKTSDALSSAHAGIFELTFPNVER